MTVDLLGSHQSIADRTRGSRRRAAFKSIRPDTHIFPCFPRFLYKKSNHYLNICFLFVVRVLMEHEKTGEIILQRLIVSLESSLAFSCSPKIKTFCSGFSASFKSEKKQKWYAMKAYKLWMFNVLYFALDSSTRLLPRLLHKTTHFCICLYQFWHCN